MAKLQKRKKKGPVPSMEEASNNLVSPPAPTPPVKEAPVKVMLPRKEPEELKPMNFKVPPDFKKAYKQFALDNDMSLVEVLKQSFEVFRQGK